jgi:hypothetical protein
MSTALVILLVVAGVLIVWALIRVRQGQAGSDVIVRCSKGHLFATIWIPGVSFKAIRLGTDRAQWCPVGRHWTTVSRVRESDLTQEDIETAHECHDIRIP